MSNFIPRDIIHSEEEETSLITARTFFQSPLSVDEDKDFDDLPPESELEF